MTTAVLSQYLKMFIELYSCLKGALVSLKMLYHVFAPTLYSFKNLEKLII